MANMNMDTVLTFEEVQADLKSYLRQSQIDINDVIDAQNIYRQIYEEKKTPEVIKVTGLLSI